MKAGFENIIYIIGFIAYTFYSVWKAAQKSKPKAKKAEEPDFTDILRKMQEQKEPAKPKVSNKTTHKPGKLTKKPMVTSTAAASQQKIVNYDERAMESYHVYDNDHKSDKVKKSEDHSEDYLTTETPMQIEILGTDPQKAVLLHEILQRPNY